MYACIRACCSCASPTPPARRWRRGSRARCSAASCMCRAQGAPRAGCTPTRSMRGARSGATSTASALPVEVVGDGFPDAYVVARRGDDIVGVAALEAHDRASLLRSLAVAPSERGRGTGIALVADRLATAAANGLASVYLLTTTAA